jgi:hypothetical protein
MVDMRVGQYTAMRGRQGRGFGVSPRLGTLAEIIGYYEKAARLAALAAPYRHGRLSAIKLIGDPNAVSTFKPNATAEELRVELAKRVAAMRDAGLIDLEALPPPDPEGGTASN